MDSIETSIKDPHHPTKDVLLKTQHLIIQLSEQNKLRIGAMKTTEGISQA